ncbi:YhgE/Pip domain-containing protein [Virgibacillus sp. MSJ-26]|uniref:YhgE/Pip domain-containing protein n=1 Tax=Virgibacillus sp. MSJ-26 TaxID=2841522 RepID=UPI001C103469|nr:YhgE/Pip domain-containing protein [Virgibacillus sp. MSJ-26]MBU5468049.1 YhgE/Pip domain-containing protein [Virgibacillus sp. MSJ-26]
MRIKNWLIVILSALLVFSTLPISVAADNSDKDDSQTSAKSGKYSTKDEVIYGNLDANGKTKDMYVVNTFHVTKPGKIVDYGNYSDVRNLTNLSDIEQTTDNEIQFQSDEEEFYFQGQLENQPLPWDISITYLLDGKEVTPDELAGQSGDFEIQLKTSENKDVDSTFFENYLLQISLTLDPLVFNDIQAPEGTEANEGKNKQISFMVLPDQEEELILTAHVNDFKMDPIDISAVPANIAIEDPDIGNMTGDMESLSDAIHQVNSGMEELNNGITELSSGAEELSNGSTEYRNGMDELNQSSGELVEGSKQIRDVLNEVSGALQSSPDMPEMGEMKDLPAGFRDMAEGLRAAAGGLDELKENYDEAWDALSGAIDGIPNSNISEKDIEKLYGSGADKNTVDELVKTYEAAQKVKQTYDAVKDGFNVVSGALNESTKPLQEMANQIDSIADGMESGMKDLENFDALTELQDGISTMASEYNTFHNGLIDYTEGVGTLATNYQDIDAGIKELSEGTSSLNSGAAELTEGTNELHNETNDLPDEMQDKIDELMEDYENSDFEPQSFVSDKNKKVDVVQFVLQTEKIEVEEPETEDVEEEEHKSMWDRFLDLFR